MLRRCGSVRWIVCAVVLAAGLRPTPARAEGYFSPFIGVNFGGVAGNQFTDALKTNSSVDYGGLIGYMGKGILGIEEEVGYSPRFFGESGRFGSTGVLTVMTNAIIGIPIGGTTGAGLRPYAVAGVGLLRTMISEPSFSDNKWAYDLGGGVMGYFSEHVGIRGDLRYLRDFQVTDRTGNPIGVVLNGGTFNFWRGTIGVVFR